MEYAHAIVNINCMMTCAHTVPLIHKFLKELASLTALKLIKMYIALFVEPCLEFGTLSGTRMYVMRYRAIYTTIFDEKRKGIL